MLGKGHIPIAPLLLLGAGGHCRSVIDVLETACAPIAGIVCSPDAPLESVLRYPALGHDDELDRLRERFTAALVTVGQIKSPAVRQHLFARLQALDFALPTITSPLAQVSTQATLGIGTIVMHQALVNTGATVGDNCIINTRSLVEHDCTIANHCHIAVGAILCGGVCVGEGTFVGAGAVIREGVRIGNNAIVSCGVTVLTHIPDKTIVRGNYCESIRCYR